MSKKKKLKLSPYQKIIITLLSGMMLLNIISECRTTVTATMVGESGFISMAYKVWVWELD
jgi:hypothetical protein